MLRYIFSAPSPIIFAEHQSQFTFCPICAAVIYYYETEAEYPAFQVFVPLSQLEIIFQWSGLYSVNRILSSIACQSFLTLTSPADDTEGCKVQLLLNTSSVISIIKDIKEILFCFICNHWFVCHDSRHAEVSVELNDIKSSHRSNFHPHRDESTLKHQKPSWRAWRWFRLMRVW